MTEPLRARLSGPAARYLDILRAYGHLDDAGAERIEIALVDLVGGTREAVVDLAMTRRVAASVLYGDRGGELDGDLLVEDWPYLFS